MRTFRLLFLTPLLVLIHCDPSAPTNTPQGMCVAPTGAPITHQDTITADETWGPESVHEVTFDIAVHAKLTIAPCAVVHIQKGDSIVASSGGSIVAVGTPTQPIQISASVAGANWGYLEANAPSTLRLAYATLSDGGGEPTNSQAAIDVRGDQLLPSQEILDVDHVTVSGSAQYGVSLRDGAAFTKGSQALTITGSAVAPMRILPRLASNVPTGSYTGNTLDAIVMATAAYGGINVEDVTFHERGVPYVVGDKYTSPASSIEVGPKHATLTIEPGVKLMFTDAGRIVEKEDSSAATTGVIVAKGTADKAIVFTSALPTPVAGAWMGIEFSKIADAGNALDHVEVRFAGGPSQSSSAHCGVDGSVSVKEDAAVAIYAQPSAPFIANSVIADSALAGIDLAYFGDYVDFRATNTFTNVVDCGVTRPRPVKGNCVAAACP